MWADEGLPVDLFLCLDPRAAGGLASGPQDLAFCKETCLKEERVEYEVTHKVC